MSGVHPDTKEKITEWEPNARVGMFIGYEEVSKFNRVYDTDTEKR